jgi:hypothetical protein
MPQKIFRGFAGCAAIMAAGAIVGPAAKGPAPADLDPSRLVVPALLLALYFAPAILAWRRDDPHLGRVFLLNLAIGWTLVGWAIVLIRAVLPPPASARAGSPAARNRCACRARTAPRPSCRQRGCAAGAAMRCRGTGPTAPRSSIWRRAAGGRYDHDPADRR